MLGPAVLRVPAPGTAPPSPRPRCRVLNCCILQKFWEMALIFRASAPCGLPAPLQTLKSATQASMGWGSLEAEPELRIVVLVIC